MKENCAIRQILDQVLNGNPNSVPQKCEECGQIVYSETGSINGSADNIVFLRVVNGKIGSPNACKLQFLSGLRIDIDPQSFRSIRAIKI